VPYSLTETLSKDAVFNRAMKVDGGLVSVSQEKGYRSVKLLS
jgi:hypothetical protein